MDGQQNPLSGWTQSEVPCSIKTEKADTYLTGSLEDCLLAFETPTDLMLER